MEEQGGGVHRLSPALNQKWHMSLPLMVPCSELATWPKPKCQRSWGMWENRGICEHCCSATLVTATEKFTKKKRVYFLVVKVSSHPWQMKSFFLVLVLSTVLCFRVTHHEKVPYTLYIVWLFQWQNWRNLRKNSQLNLCMKSSVLNWWVSR